MNYIECKYSSSFIQFQDNLSVKRNKRAFSYIGFSEFSRLATDATPLSSWVYAECQDGIPQKCFLRAPSEPVLIRRRPQRAEGHRQVSIRAREKTKADAHRRTQAAMPITTNDGSKT